MDLLVCVKLVSESQYTDSFRDTPAERLSAGRLVMNPADEYALELALRLRQNDQNGSLTVLTMGPKAAADILRHALAMGADRAVHLCDPSFAGADTLVTSSVLAAAVRTLDFKGLILCGQKAIDSETGHIGPQLAVRLDLPILSHVLAFSTQPELTVTQLRDSGTVSLPCPAAAVLTVCRGVEMVRRPTVLGMRNAQQREILTLTGWELGLDTERTGASLSPTQVIKAAPIQHRRRNGIGSTDSREGAEHLIRLLTQMGVSG